MQMETEFRVAVSRKVTEGIHAGKRLACGNFFVKARTHERARAIAEEQARQEFDGTDFRADECEVYTGR